MMASLISAFPEVHHFVISVDVAVWILNNEQLSCGVMILIHPAATEDSSL